MLAFLIGKPEDRLAFSGRISMSLAIHARAYESSEMSRVRADDYEDKQQLILDAAAKLFAQNGYPHSSVIDIAKRCRASKSKVYHYFKSKDQILFQLLHEYCLFTVQTFDLIDESLPPQERLSIFLRNFIERPARMRYRHITLVNDIKYLPERLKKQIVLVERSLIDRVVALLKEVQKGNNVKDRVLRTYVLLLFGTINGIDLWFDPSGPMAPDELSGRVSRLFIDGICSEP